DAPGYANNPLSHTSNCMARGIGGATTGRGRATMADSPGGLRMSPHRTCWMRLYFTVLLLSLILAGCSGGSYQSGSGTILNQQMIVCHLTDSADLEIEYSTCIERGGWT